jgi:hypothetical protein
MMVERNDTPQAGRQPEEELLAWENLGAQPARQAFRKSLAELMLRPGRFFRAMAVSGGLHEPLTFFAIVLTAAVIVAFPAALAYFGLAAPDPERVTAAVYRLHALPPRVAGLLLVLLPLTVAAACGAAVLLGTLFHVGGRPFSGGGWEGSVSVWLYSAGAALVPLTAAMAAVFVVALVGYLLGIPWPQTRHTTAFLAQWAALILCGTAVAAGVLLIVADAALGTARASGLDPMQGTAAALAGLVLVTLALGGTAWAFVRWGLGRGLVTGGAVLCVMGVLTALYIVRSRRAEGSA